MRVAKPSSETEPGPYRAPYWQPRRRHFSRRTAELGLPITDAADAGTLTIINADPVDVADTCPDCSVPGVKRHHVRRRLVDLPVVGFPTRLHDRVPRFTCTNPACSRKIFQASLQCADDGAKLTRWVTRWILQRLAVDRMSVAATAKALGVGRELVTNIAVTADRNLVYADPAHLAGVRTLGVDEHVREAHPPSRRAVFDGHCAGGPDPTG